MSPFSDRQAIALVLVTPLMAAFPDPLPGFVWLEVLVTLGILVLSVRWLVVLLRSMADLW